MGYMDMQNGSFWHDPKMGCSVRPKKGMPGSAILWFLRSTLFMPFGAFLGSNMPSGGIYWLIWYPYCLFNNRVPNPCTLYTQIYDHSRASILAPPAIAQNPEIVCFAIMQKHVFWHISWHGSHDMSAYP